MGAGLAGATCRILLMEPLHIWCWRHAAVNSYPSGHWRCMIKAENFKPVNENAGGIVAAF